MRARPTASRDAFLIRRPAWEDSFRRCRIDALPLGHWVGQRQTIARTRRVDGGFPWIEADISGVNVADVVRLCSMANRGQGRLINVPPAYCQYAEGGCDQSFDGLEADDAFFLYPSEPRLISATIEEAIRIIRAAQGTLKLVSWTEIGVPGQIIFCKICQYQRFASVVVPDVTTLNLNVLFEIGYALGLDPLILPIRDTSIIKDQKTFDELRLVDTFGYIDFANS
jgi:hypothetical protein